MPRKFFKRKPKTLKRKPTRKPRVKRIPRAPGITGAFRGAKGQSPFGPVKYCKLTYTQSNSLTTGTGGIYGSEQVFRLNSLYDPDWSGTGHQPYGYDQVTPLYALYFVRAVKINLVITDPSADGIVVAACLQSSNNTFAVTGKSVDSIKEQPFSITRSLNNSGKQVTVVNSYVPIQAIEGLTRTQLIASLAIYQAGVSANPARSPYLRIAVGSLRGNSGDTCIVRTTLTFYTQFSDRLIQSQS